MDMRPSDNLERMRSLLSRMEHAVDSARDRRNGVPNPTAEAATPKQATTPTSISNAAPVMQRPQADAAAASFRFPTPTQSGKPKARAMSLEEFDDAFKRLASRQTG